jgi:hypothetical protein
MTARSARPHGGGCWMCGYVGPARWSWPPSPRTPRTSISGSSRWPAPGADETGVRLWPLSVDGLVLLATVGLLRADHRTARRNRWALWAAFGFGIAVSLAANIAAAPSLGWQPVLVAGWPPIALLLAVELLAHHPIPAPAVPAGESHERAEPGLPPTLDATGPVESSETGTDDSETTITLAPWPDSNGKGSTREEIMWAHYQRERAAGRTPTGAELDRVANTNNYGRGVFGPLAPRRPVGRARPACGSDGVGTTGCRPRSP